MAECPYAGKIKNQGTQQVKGPYAQDGAKGTTNVKTGSDLRSGGGKS